MATYLRIGQLIVAALVIYASLLIGLQPEPPLFSEILDELQKIDLLDCTKSGSNEFECQNLMLQLKKELGIGEIIEAYLPENRELLTFGGVVGLFAMVLLKKK